MEEADILKIGFALQHGGLSDDEIDIYLEHFGVKGMKWGQRKDRTPGVPRATDKMARKDAEETARAQMYYGKGAGTRRKLINKSVEAKKQRDPLYAKAFDNHSSKQDLSTHATKAVKERTTTDRKERNKQRRGAIARKLTNQMGTQAAYTALAIGGVVFFNSPKGRALMKKGYKTVKDSQAARQGAAYTKKTMRILKDLQDGY